jgi:eukaryotic-like serine/threonine-protein kinase
MPTDRREQLLKIYHLALALEGEDRDAFLTEACGGDVGLRHEIEALLAHDPPSNFLEAPAGIPDSALAGAAAAGDLTGQQIGPYSVRSRLGSGGMGDVFRAHDTKLRRDVAIKMLPPVFGHDRERLARFEREARVLATLNHPHIGAIYGLEHAHGVPALVLELVEGETLAERIARRGTATGAGVPIQEALSFARQIADALEAAHEKGIIHRDLKPGNIKITPDGTVKVLDFGLAKAAEDDTPSDVGTRTGLVMGTAAYMSPEQAEGQKVDKRTDIWAFGCVLYEMLTGRRSFAGATGAETVAAVLHKEPDWAALPSGTPAAVQVVLERCLQKDPKERVRDVGDVRLALTGAFSVAVPPKEASGTSLSAASLPLWRRAALATASLAVVALATTAAMWFRATPQTAALVTRLPLGTHGEAALQVSGTELELAITPDGSRVVYVGDGGRRLFVRALNQLEPVVIATGTNLRNPFVSPDGQWVGYNDSLGNGSLWKVPIGGGPPLAIVSPVGPLRGAAWLPDNTIVFASNVRNIGLQRVSADGGMPRDLTKPDAAGNVFGHFWPDALPDGRGILYTIFPRTGGLAAAKIAIYDLQTNTSTDLLAGASNGMYVRSGRLVYVAAGTLWAVAFDVDRRTIKGPAVPVLKPLAVAALGAGNVAVSATGTLAYVHTAGYDPFARTLSWIDRHGKLEPLGAPPHPYTQPRFSHDGTRIVHATGRGPDNNIWVLDVSRNALTRLRTEAARDQQPSWSPDDRWILFASDRATAGGGLQIWRQAADGTGEPELLVESGAIPTVTPDGTRVIYSAPASGNVDIMEKALDGSQKVRGLVQTPFDDRDGELSPDGRWLAYHSTFSGQQEVWVRPYPDTAAGRWQVSTSGGSNARWSPDGQELFYIASDGALMGVQVKYTGSTWTASSPVKMLEPGYWSTGVVIGPAYAVSPDGKRFLVVTPPKEGAGPPDIVVIQHWDEELKALAPSK